MPKQIDFYIKARKKLLAGATTLAKSTAVTYGPLGRTVMLDRASGLLGTKDGVTVAREVILEDPVENMGAATLRQACIKVNDQVGDGTTTAAIISAALLEECHRLVAAGYDPAQLSRGVLEAARYAIKIVDNTAVPIESQEELERVAFVASNGDIDVSKNMAEACMAVGNDGTISIEDGHGIDIELDYKDGMEIDRGAISSSFLRDSDGTERVLDNPVVAVIGSRLSSLTDITHVLEESSQWKGHDLLLFAESVDGQALTTMLLNDSKDVVHSVAVAAPGFGPKKVDYLKDIAALTGATFIDPALGMDFREKFDPEWFGGLRKARIKAKTSMLIAHKEAREGIKERIRELNREAESLKSDYDRDKNAERTAKLAGGLCVMRVGGATEPALKERRARVEDALGSVRAALEEGVVPGAGSIYLEVSEHILAEKSHKNNPGWHLMAKALRTPLVKLADNAGQDGLAVVHRASKARKEDLTGWLGWDVTEGVFRDLGADPPIIDPAPVAKAVIEAAASVTATLLTAEVSIVESKA